MHGGDDGELPIQEGQEKPMEPIYIFECTYAEIQANHIKTKYFL